jgi:hypothetical protein
MRKHLRELKRTFPSATVETTNGGHYRLRLSNGRVVIVAGSPSDWRFMRNVTASVRRYSKAQSHLPNGGSQ